MKKLLSLLLTATLAFSLVACSQEGTQAEEREPVTLRLLAASASEFETNIVADQLKKAGYNVEITLTPELSTRIATQQAGEYDICFGGWSNRTASLDESVRSIYYSGAASNLGGVADPVFDEMMDNAATLTYPENLEAYGEIEKYLVEEMAYIVPLYTSLKLHAYDSDVIVEESVNTPKGSSQLWHTYEYVNETDIEDRSLVFSLINSGVMTHLDPLQTNDTTAGDSLLNTNIRLLTRGLEDEITTKDSLSLSYAISEDNLSYYFLLRDDIGFSKVENGVAVDTGVKVGAEDVVFSLNRAKDELSVPSHKNYSKFSYVQSVETVGDITELETTLTGTGETVLEALTAGIELSSITESKENVDNAGGVYQVVKITATEAYPQMLDPLTSDSAGILSEEQVTAINSAFEVETFDITKDVAYGDFNAVKNGDNHLWSSGAYVLTSIDDYTVEFTKNPAYMGGEMDYIENVTYKFFKDKDSALSALRSGETDYLADLDPSKYDLMMEEGESINVVERTSNSVSYLTVNVNEGALLSNSDLRHAILYAMDPSSFIAAKNNLVVPAYSTLAPLLGNEESFAQDLELSQEYLDAYYASLEN